MILKNIFSKKIILFAGLVLGFLLYSNSALAQAAYNSLVKIPGIGSNPGVTGYLGGLYAFLISVVGVVAMGAIVIGGARYLTSVGNPSAIEDAKHTIWSAIYGLILALVSWVLIGTINPDILVLKNPAMPWKAVGYNPTSLTPQCALPGGNGTVSTPCNCIDGAKVVTNITIGKTATKIVMTSSPPNPVNSAVNFTVNAVLTNASTGAAVNGVPISFKPYKSDFSSSGSYFIPGNTNAAGSIGIMVTSLGCDDSRIYEAVFFGDATYAPISASININITGAGTPCGVFPNSGGALWSAQDVCNQTCADKSKQSLIGTMPAVGYHCVGAKVSTNKPLNPDGISATMKVNEQITLDGITNSIFPDSLTKSGATYNWIILRGISSVFTSNDSILKLDSSVAGYPFTVASNYEIILEIVPPASAPGVPESVNNEPKFWLEVSP